MYTAMEVLTTRVTKELLRAIREIEEEEKAERAEVVRRLLDRSVKEWRLSKAVKMVSFGSWTVRKAAAYIGVSYHDMLDILTEAGVDSGLALREMAE